MRFTPFALLVLLLVSLTLLAAPGDKIALITVTKRDGTVLKGQFTASDPKGVSVQPIAKNAADGTVVVVPWTEIKSVSNGLTRQKAIDQWKKEHPEDRCTDCRATGHVDCAACKGTGRDASSAKQCATCKGEQTTPCKQPKCEQGTIVCPSPCLKLAEGNWVKKEDGKLWRRFPVKGGGSFEVSEGHVGEVVVMKGGEPQPPIKCPTCNGTQKTTCPKCGGDALAPCPTCTSAARANPCPEKCQRGQVACKTCDGTGLKSLAAK